MMREEIAIVIQLRKANATAIWYFVHSSPRLQPPKSSKYNTVMPAEEAAAARDNVAVTCHVVYKLHGQVLKTIYINNLIVSSTT